MDMTLLTSAIAAGATEALKDTATQFVKEAYARLKNLLGRRLDGVQGGDDVRDAIRWVERKPDAKARHEVLAESLAESKLALDEDITCAVKELVAILQRFAPQTAAQFDLAVQAGGAAVGNNNNVAGKGGIVIKGDTDGNVSISRGPQVKGDYIRGDKVAANKIERQINTGGGAYLGDNINVPSIGSFIGRDQIVINNNYAEAPLPEPPATTPPAARYLAPLLNTYFSLEELEGLCFEMGIDADNLRGQTKEAKARALVSHCERHGTLDELKRVMRIARPNLRAQLSQ